MLALNADRAQGEAMTSHRYAEYTDEMELAYHLHYEHNMPLADALVAERNGTVVDLHRGAHA